MDGCKTNPEKSSAIKVSDHILSSILMSAILLFKDVENKHMYTEEKTA